MEANPATDKFKLHQCSGLKKSSPDSESHKPSAEPVGKSLHIPEPPQGGWAKLSDIRGSQVQDSATYWSKGPREVEADCRTQLTWVPVQLHQLSAM